MAYTDIDFPTKRALKDAVASGQKVRCYQPGPFGPALKPGRVALEGPHYPKPHKWYTNATLDADLCIIPGSIK